MGAYELKFLESIIALVIVIFIVRYTLILVGKVGRKFDYQKDRIKILKKAISLVVYTIFAGVLVLIWGIAPHQLTGYLASLFTVLGVAFLAQWSIVSNITSSFIIFFNHQVRIGDEISILDKEYQVDGQVNDIGIFFIIIKTAEHEYVSLPSNVFMLKMIKKVKK